MKVAISLNGFLTEFVNVENGLRQGDPLSPLLYNITAQPFIDKIKNTINGINIGNSTLKVLAFADDIVVFNKDLNDEQKLITEIESYGHASNAKLNYNKCKRIVLNTEFPSRFEAIDSNFKYLGFYFNNQGINEPKCKKMCLGNSIQYIRHLEQRNLSLVGKALVINSLVTSRLWYISNCILFSDNDLKNLRTEIRRYLFGSNSIAEKIINSFYGLIHILLPSLDDFYLRRIVSCFILLSFLLKPGLNGPILYSPTIYTHAVNALS